ncbi:hypothetical protein XM53_17150 [Roseovarius atlanticus]|uniref:Uncharacterized protein n=1 Tax=Roseovarius atlanticus TaxID=1641875 RepID=A0A0T5NQU9_9RHOB|nr:hypothetical protein [Roseovarius atlanticus]KRS11305.1 hypothetical protein XM53_17150 [Roseovarius atlanticus]
MMGRWLAILVSAIWPLAVQAQGVSVRSGDHEDFTRLVFNLPSRTDWTIENTEDEAVLRFARRGLSFDISKVFDRIQRDRLAEIDIDRDTQSVTLRFACACEATGFWFRQSMLVVDVAAKETGSTGQIRDTSSDNRSVALQLPTRGTSAATTLMHQAIGFEPPETEQRAEMASPLLRETGLEESRDRLLRQVSRAASQGLLAPKRTLRQLVEKVAEPSQPVPPEPALQAPEERDSTLPFNLNINVQTAVDRDFLSALEAGDQTRLASRCLDAEFIDVANWGSSEPFWEQIGPLRGRMTSEFDRIDEQSVGKLAQLYLYFGFGVEARNIASLLPDGSERKKIYTALAQIMDNGSAGGTVLAGQLDCDAPGAMWSALAHEKLPADAQVNHNAIVRAFSGLPPHLRKHLGPILSARLLSAGHARESSAILRILDRVDETMTSAAKMVVADLQIQNGEREAAEESLDTVIEANSEMSPEAVARQIDSQIERGGQVPAKLAQLASAYAYEYAGSPLGQKLARSHVLALGATGAFDDAFSELGRFESDTEGSLDHIRADLTNRLATHGAPFEILRYVLSGETARPELLSQESALAMAEHLLDAGFYQQSRDMLEQTFHGRNMRQARLIRARAALKLNQPRLAEVELLGLEGKDVNILRAQARSMVGEHRQAYELFRSAGLEAEANREAWLAEGGVADAEPPTPNDLTGLAEEETEIGVLAQNKLLLEDVGATRATLQALLAETPDPSPEN